MPKLRHFGWFSNTVQTISTPILRSGHFFLSLDFAQNVICKEDFIEGFEGSKKKLWGVKNRFLLAVTISAEIVAAWLLLMLETSCNRAASKKDRKPLCYRVRQQNLHSFPLFFKLLLRLFSSYSTFLGSLEVSCMPEMFKNPTQIYFKEPLKTSLISSTFLLIYLR